MDKDEKNLNDNEDAKKRMQEQIKRNAENFLANLAEVEDDENYDEIDDIRYKALKFCLKKGYASVSLIQRRFPIGYIQSCKIIDWMESNGFISRGQNGEQKLIITQEVIDILTGRNKKEQVSDEKSDKKTEDSFFDDLPPVEEMPRSELNKILEAAAEAAEEFGSSYIGSEHLVYAMLDNECIGGKVLKACNVNVLEYLEYFKRSIDTKLNIRGFTPRTKHMIEQAKTLAEEIDGEGAIAGTEHLLLAVLSSSDCLATRILKAINVDFKKLASTLEKVLRTKK